MRHRYFNKIIFLIVIACILVTYSCKNETEFDTGRWKVKHGMSYPYRESMAGDLVKNHDFRGFTRGEVVNLLGDPDYDDTINNRYCIYYEILTEFGPDMDPVFSRTLAVEFDRGMKVRDYKIEEWRKTEE